MALCARPKNGLRTMLKSLTDGKAEVEVAALVKADTTSESGELLFVGYRPGVPDYDGWVADAAIVKKMARAHMRSGAELDLEHDGKVLKADAAFLAETFIIQKSDPRFADWKNTDGTPAGDLTGAWGGVIQIDDPELRKACRDGRIGGVSVFGRAAVEPLTKSSAAPAPEMTPELIAALAKSITDGVVAALKPAPAKAEDVKPPAPAIEAPKFEGDPLDPTALETFEKSMRAYEFQQKVASGKLTADQIATLRKSMQETKPSDEEAGVKPEDSTEVKELKHRLFKAQRVTNAPAKAGPSAEKTQFQLDVAEGRELAKAINGEVKESSFAWDVVSA